MKYGKRVGMALALALATTAMAAPAVARDHDRDGRRGHQAKGQHDRYSNRGRDDRRYSYDRRDDRRRDHDRRDDRRYANDRGRYDRRPDRDYRYRDDRRHVYYGPAPRPVAYYPAPRVRHVGPPPWSRGRNVHHYGRPVYVVRDYGHYGLRHPPRGYHWMRDDYGDYLLVAIATGLIADLILR